MNIKRSTNNYSHAIFNDGGYWEYRIYRKCPHDLLECGVVTSKRDATAQARAAIRRLESGTHYTQQSIAA